MENQMKKIRFGIIGLGNQGTTYAKNLFAQGKIENGVISAMCDIDPSRVERMKETFPDVAYFSDYLEMLDSGLCDAVLIETPHYLHPEMAIACFERKIPVIAEKPAGVYALQVREMNAAADRCGATFAVMFNQRTNCVYRKMREMVASGAVGELQRVVWVITDWYRTQFYYDTGSWRATWDGEGGGVLINQCPHQLDLVSWVVGQQPATVRGFCAYGKWHDVEVEDEVTAYFTYANGATGVFVTTTGETPGVNRLEISGTGGKLVVEGDKLLYYKNEQDAAEFSRTAQASFARPKVVCEEVETDGKNPQHAGIINNFANALLGLEPFFVDGREGIRGVELMNAIEYSGWHNGEEVALPVDGEAYLKELKEHRAHSRRKTGNGAVSDTAGTYGSDVK